MSTIDLPQNGVVDFYKYDLETYKRDTGYDLVTAVYADDSQQYFITKHRSKWTAYNKHGAYMTAASTLTQCKIQASRLIECINERLLAADAKQPKVAKVDFCIHAVRNPETGNTCVAVANDYSDTVCISLDGFYFESNAYHLPSWCAEKGLVYAAREAQDAITV